MSSPCKWNTQCVDMYGSFACECLGGFVNLSADGLFPTMQVCVTDPGAYALAGGRACLPAANQMCGPNAHCWYSYSLQMYSRLTRTRLATRCAPCRRAEVGYAFTCECRAGFFGNAYDQVAGCASIDAPRSLLLQGTLCLPVAYLDTLAPAFNYSLDFRAAALEAAALLNVVLNASAGYVLGSAQVTAFMCALLFF